MGVCGNCLTSQHKRCRCRGECRCPQCNGFVSVVRQTIKPSRPANSDRPRWPTPRGQLKTCRLDDCHNLFHIAGTPAAFCSVDCRRKYQKARRLSERTRSKLYATSRQRYVSMR